MKKESLNILACPKCKTSLELTVESETAGEIVAGSLSCISCGQSFKIENGVPDLLPPDF